MQVPTFTLDRREPFLIESSHLVRAAGSKPLKQPSLLYAIFYTGIDPKFVSSMDYFFHLSFHDVLCGYILHNAKRAFL